MPFSLDPWAHDHRSRVDQALAALFDDAFPPSFARACRYPLTTGGKRMRPLLCLAAAEAVRGAAEGDAFTAALAVELVHTYSLVHDDLPCMDDDDLRRGVPTVHKAFGEDVAVLVGDALLTEAFALLADTAEPGRMVRELAHAAGHRGMVGGQVLDVDRADPARDLDALQRVHHHKTGALIRASVRLGGIAARADARALEALSTYGDAVGLAFQLMDDVLDKDEAASEDGPPSYVRLLGVEGTLRKAHAERDRALAAIASLPSRDALAALARYTVERDH